MSVPPSFSDIGKKAKDLLGKGFPAHEVKLELKAVTPRTTYTASVTEKKCEKSPVSGELKAEFEDGDWKVTTTYPTDCDPKVALEYNVSQVSGLKLEVEGQTSPDPSKRSAQLGLGYKREHLNFSTKFKPQKASLTSSLVLGYENALFGVDVCGSADGGVDSYNVATAYVEKTHQLAFFARKRFTNFGASLYYQKNAQTEIGTSVSYEAGAKSVLEFGAKHVLDQDSSIKAKVDSEMRLGVGYSQKLRPSIVAVLGANYCYCKNQLGVGLNINFEA